jgi:hypothetical protein
MLRFLANEAPREHGFFYHFMEMDTGARAWKCELSTIDTSLFLSGAIVAREYFNDPEITTLVNRLYADIDWAWFLNKGKSFAMGWHEEAGFSRFRWMKYSEHMILSLLSMGAPANAAPPDIWQSWKREPAGNYGGFHFIQGAPLFVHQFSHSFVDFRGLRDAYADYYRNSMLATLAQRQFCVDLSAEFPSWNERLWGITASDSATGYKAWGGPPRTMEYNALDGTIVPCAAAGSVPFAPHETLITLRHMRTAFGDRIWKRYGFVDSFNPETGWVNPDVIGIDLGITLLQAENARTGLVWHLFMKAPEVQRALSLAGFISKDLSLSWSERDQVRNLASKAWKSLQDEPLRPETSGMQISSVIAAQALGLINGTDGASRATNLLKSCVLPQSSRAIAEYAASLVTLRQSIRSLSPEATRLLDQIDWDKVSTTTTRLGSAERLAIFFQVAKKVRPPSAWTKLDKSSIRQGPVWVLTPAGVSDQLTPGLWLDEEDIITGASTAQLAYAEAIPGRPTAGKTFPHDLLETALLIGHFPTSACAELSGAPPPPSWMAQASLADRATLLITVANLLAPDSLRLWFQHDPLVKAGREAIPDFGAAEFGGDTSLFWRRELAGPLEPPPERTVEAFRADTPRSAWQWTEVKGQEFNESVADARPGDPRLEMRFAFTWDEQALRFHAEVKDDLPKVAKPSNRNGVELFVDRSNNGMVWSGPDELQYTFKATGGVEEWFHKRPATAQVKRNEDGYTVEAEIKWSDLGLTPRSGLKIGVSPAVVSEGSFEWEPSKKLNWRYYRRADEVIGLGTLILK